MQMGFYFNQSRCIGCYTCVVACKDWHDVPAGPASWIHILSTEKGKFPNPSLSHLFNACRHCADPLCVAVCPAQAISKRDEDGIVVVDREKCREAARCGIIDTSGDVPQLTTEQEAPCQVACPAHLNIPAYIALIAHGRFSEALDLIRKRMPLPGVCGRVCLAPCEVVCSRKNVEEAVSINALKRFAADHAAESTPEPVARTKDEKVAVIGSGPAGLSAAYDLVRMGYGVTIFEALPVAGGMLAVGIPEYRLPRSVLQKDIDYIRGLGVEIRLNCPVGTNGLTVDSLRQQGYQALFVAVGAHKSRMLNIPGEDMEGVYHGVDFLRDINLGKGAPVGERVAVIGGGNVAIDAARTALRRGAKEVSILYRRSREEMPAIEEEIKAAESEGITLHYLASPTRMLGENGRVSGMECVQMKLMEPDASGRRRPAPVEGSQFVIDVDMVIPAIGQAPDVSFLDHEGNITMKRDGTLEVDPASLETSQPGIFAGGDVVTGPAIMIEAIASGQRAAIAIDSYLRFGLVTPPTDRTYRAEDIKVTIPDDVASVPRQKMPALAAADRSSSFDEVNLGLTEEMAITEAKRCLNCAGHLCRDVCPYDVPQFGAEAYAKMQKCDLCLERWSENKKPICVEACPMRALDAGPLEELKAKYGDIREVEGFVYSEQLKPSIVFKPKQSA